MTQQKEMDVYFYVKNLILQDAESIFSIFQVDEYLGFTVVTAQSAASHKMAQGC